MRIDGFQLEATQSRQVESERAYRSSNSCMYLPMSISNGNAIESCSFRFWNVLMSYTKRISCRFST